MKGFGKTIRNGVAAASLMALLTACGGGGGIERSGLETLAHPDLSAVETAAREQLEGQRQRLEDALGQRRTSDQELAGAFGAMAELYHAYELYEPAAVAYRNAEQLDPQSFLWPYLLAVLHQAEGRPDTAEYFRRALERSPDNAPARLRLARAELAAGQLDPAAAGFESLLDRGPFLAAAQHGLGEVAARRGDDQEAVRRFEAALERQPRATAVRHPLGMALRRLGRLDEAAAALAEPGDGEVTFSDPLVERLEKLAVSSGALMRRGNRALVAGRLDEAIDAFRQAVAANPDYSEARRNLALALLDNGQVDDAVSELRTATERHPDNVWLHFDLGNAQLKSGQPERAVEAFSTAVELVPDFESGYFNLGNTLAGLQRWPEAKTALEKALELDPEDPRARYLLAMARHRTGDSQPASRELEALLEEDPDNRVAREGLAAVYSESRRVAQAYRVTEQELGLEIDDERRVTVLSQLAELAWKLGRKEQATRHYRQAAQLAPESSTVHTNLANVLQLSGQTAEAAEIFARAVELDSSNATAWLSEGTLWVLEGRHGQARQRLEAAVAEHPNDAKLVHTLARLLATTGDSAVRDGAAAVGLAQKAYGLESSLEHAETVAMAMAAAGQFEAAIRWQRSLVMNAVRAGDQATGRRLSINLRRYENREAIRLEDAG